MAKRARKKETTSQEALPDARELAKLGEVGFPFVLRHELAVIAERRKRLQVERGELGAARAPLDETAAEKPQGEPPAETAVALDESAVRSKDSSLTTAWQARLLGVAFSGGGIRSATFNLGVLQALARRGLLRYVDYLSTVSGGGYIGSWLTALSQRRFARTREDARRVGLDETNVLELGEEGFAAFEEQLARSAGDGDGRFAPDHEDRAIRFLREFSNYLTPRLGLFSGDTWALLAIYVRNALLNQLVLFFALAAVLLAPRLLSYAAEKLIVHDGTGLLIWVAALLALHLFVCWKLGKNLAGVTSRTVPNENAEASPWVMLWIGAPLLVVGVSAASWLGYLSAWLASVTSLPWVVAAVAGSLVSLFTWTCAWASARWHYRKETWGPIEQKFWTRMIWYSLASGTVFGVCLHAAGAWLFTDDVYSGYKLIAGPPVLALAVLGAGVLHVGLAGRNVSPQYTEWLSRFGGLMSIGALGWIGFNALVFLGPLLVAWLRGLGEAALSSGWLLTTLTSVFFGRRVVASSSKSLPRLFMHVAPWIFIVGLGVALTALLQAGLHFGTTQYLQDELVESAAAPPEVPPLSIAERAAHARQTVYESLEPASAAREVFGRMEIGDSAVEVRGRVVEAAGSGVAIGAGRETGEDGGRPSALEQLMVDYGAWLHSTEDWRLVLLAIAVAGILTGLLSLRIDINVFSLHGMYANRLVRCYLGASVSERSANSFSGLSWRDDLRLHAVPRAIGQQNILVHALGDGQMPGKEPIPGQESAYPGPYHLINTAINLVAGGNLAYQERKAAAFLLSPLYCGFRQERSIGEGAEGQPMLDAFRPSIAFSSQPKPLTLGEAMATSGAAASPNMGYHSTPAFAFLMGVFNIRLGRWVGNPQPKGKSKSDSWLRSGPRFALLHLVKEMFGLTNSSSRFVYLSDGGHFENLGIYELVRRRCRYIIACDGGADENYRFEDLANAIRKCRTDLGVEIDLDVRQIAQLDGDRCNGAPCAVGHIRYSENEVGTILYIKASRRQGLPSDVMHYAAEHPAFPHESTADQFFSESQFESYRRLGHVLAGEVLDSSRGITRTGVDVDQVFRDLEEAWCRPSRSIASNFGGLSDAVDEVFERLRTTKELAFLTKQFYPEWRSLLREPSLNAAAQAKDLVEIPRDEGELRQAFYFCNSLMQLMEKAYISLNLETEWQHPDNSGWINVFNHWAWSGMFRVTWAVSAATYGRRFRAFCERRLKLDLGVVAAESVGQGGGSGLNLEGSGLNSHERRQIEWLPLRNRSNVSVYRLELRVPNPIKEDDPPLVKFGFGYAVLDGDELVMYRVQDHLRGMGLGRKGLVELVSKRGAELRISGITIESLRLFLEEFKEPADPGKIADFRAMVISVNEEWAEKNA